MERVALVDIGSNALRLLLARVDGRRIRLDRSERYPTRLAAGAGRLPDDAMARTIRAIERFVHALPSRRPVRVLAIATSAVREASNRREFLDALQRRIGVAVEILSGREEARLGAAAALAALPIQHGLILDLGGGSMQATRVQDGEPAAFASLPLGAVRLTARFLRHDPPTPRELRRLRAAVRKHLLGHLPPAAAGGHAVGIGGTVRALARLYLAASGNTGGRRQGLRLDLTQIATLRARLAALPLASRRRLRGLKADRADIIVAGAVVIEEALRFGGYDGLTVCTGGVRDGVLLRAAAPGLQRERRSA